ncbi:MAG TPA: HAD family hydrolase [Candidatus Lokiarchaeia archaeon]|nr:HAD family hydrolase [Candidatus Lokiarchaeia archaeon]
MNITTIIFDLNETVVSLKLEDSTNRYLEQIGVQKLTLWKAVGVHWPGFETGQFGQEELLNRAFTDLHLDCSLVPLALEFIYDDIILVEGIEEILASLHGRYRLLMLAGDGEDFLNKKLEKFNLRHYFEKIYCTCYEGLRKFDAQIFQNLLTEEQLNPSECLYVDDRVEFVHNALDTGMNSISFLNVEQLKRELQKFAIFV